ncbi:MAG TPA: tetratricopeptide repeat protein [Actinophytocola sp.]|uniref:tetratricopeptide repeat protein n=1 Tax=Actinophytocola sp. TaxID=1872138 RepID=UPI002DF8E4E2|nr:tetratricopeptide repeat protein [Actinophytocola sp.]
MIQLDERAHNTDGSFHVRVTYRDGVAYDVTVTDPASEDVEKLFAWYFEEHLRYPFLDADRRTEAVASLEEYGENLFTQVFGGDPGRRYRAFQETGFDNCRIEISGSAAFHRLHWEALRDPELDTPLALRLPITRRADLHKTTFKLPDPRPTLNILLVTARPNGPRDVGYRTISRPLLDALRQASMPVTLDLVRPGTWPALRDHLRDVSERRGTGWYHLVHFDVHGAFTESDSVGSGGYLFASEQPDHKQGFLFFETGEEGQADPRPASEVAALLAEHRVPMAVLNACQSAMQTDSEAALAHQLVDAGVPVVVGMAYSVTVTAAARAMPLLYHRLAQQSDADKALLMMRRHLHDDPQRQGYFDQQLPLQDWVLPVVFQQQPVTLNLRPMDDQEADEFYSRQGAIGEEPSPEYGFVGRDLDIQAIERLLLVEGSPNQVLVRGMAGAGKSTLLAHLGWWWQRTGLVERVFSFSYDQRAWTVGQMVRAIASQLWSGVEFARWEEMSEPGKRERVAQEMRATRHLLIIDNAESITASPAAIPHALAESERDLLRQWLARLRGGRTLVVWGSREAEEWAVRDSFGTNVYELGGLDPQAASVLTDRILTRHRANHYHDDPDHRDALTELLRLLGGYPLPLEVVLPTLATTPPRAVVDELNSGGTGADPVGLIRSAIEYSHGKLDPTIQNSLLMLAPFVATIPGGPALARYQELLAEYQPAEDGWGTVNVTAGLAAAVEIGLAADHDQFPGWAQIMPVLPYFLRQRLYQHPHWWTATRHAHYDLHTELGQQLRRMMVSQEPDQRAAGRAATQASYANLTGALAFAVEHHQPVIWTIGPLDEYLDQTSQQTARWQLLHDIITALAARPDQIARRELMFTYDLAGSVAQEQRRIDQAGDLYRQALDLALEFNDRGGVAKIYHRLGVVAQLQRRFDQAENFYHQALKLKLEFNDRHSAANTYHELGFVAQEQQHLDQAEDLYHQALKLKLEFNDRHSAVNTYHDLGRVAQEQQHLDQAEDLYRQALELALEFNDRHSAARAYHQLGMVAQEQRRLDQAEDLYRQALELALEFNDRHSAASAYHNLGMVAQEQRRLGRAEDLYRQALQAFQETSDDRAVSQTRTRLGSLLADLGRHTEAFDALFDAVISWRRITGNFDAEALRFLGGLMGHVDPQAVQRKFDSLDQAIAAELRERLRELGT